MDTNFLTALDLQKMGFSRNRAYAILRSDDIRTVKIGRRLYLDKDELTRWLDSHVMQNEEDR